MVIVNRVWEAALLFPFLCLLAEEESNIGEEIEGEETLGEVRFTSLLLKL
jgi:hypothetical protein